MPGSSPQAASTARPRAARPRACRPEAVQVSPTEQRRRGGLGLLGLRGTVHERRDLVGKSLLAGAQERLLRGLLLEVLDLLAGEEREDPQQLADLLVLDVEPELVEGVRREHLGVEPQGAALGLAVLGAVGLGDQRRGERVAPCPRRRDGSARPRP